MVIPKSSFENTSNAAGHPVRQSPKLYRERSSWRSRPGAPGNHVVAVALLVTLLSLAPAFAQDGDPAVGERVYRQCMTCHAVEPGVRRAGPHLAGIMGRPAGSVEGFRYSRALRESGIVWNEETLPDYLLDPRRTLPGTSMTIGLRREADLRDLMAYLATL